MTKKNGTGEGIPKFRVQDHAGYAVTEEDVLGIPLVIYFYPKDDTPGCTAEACFFQEHLSEFDALQVLVIGVSPDSVESHKKFVEKNKLQFTLLSDEKKKMSKAFGVLKGGVIIRSTFIINARGIIQWIEKPVNLEGHVDRVLHALNEHCSDDFCKYKSFEKDYLSSGKEEVVEKEVTAEEKALRRKIMEEYGISERDFRGK